MTQADTASAVGRSLDSRSTRSQGQAAKMTDPLPDGWTYFCSKADHGRGLPSRWYATAPYSVSPEMKEAGLAPTVDASTWPDLHVAVNAQIDLYRDWMDE